MFSLRVSRSELLERLNCDAYSPELLEAARVISTSGISVELLGELVRSPINNSIRNIEGELDTPNTSVPMFRPADFDGAFVSVDTAPKVSKAFEARHQKARVYPGDLVLGIAGTIARAGMVPSGCEYGAVNGSCARIAPQNGSSGYLCAFLQSKYGYASLMRLAVGSVQKHLNLEDLPATPIPTPAPPAQTYIGDKVRQAERLRARARELRTEISKCLTPFNPDALPAGRVSRTKPTVIEESLNPNAYMPNFLKAEEIVLEFNPKTIAEISESVADGPFGSNLKVDDYRDEAMGVHPVVRVGNCVDAIFQSDDLVWIDSKKQRELLRSEVKPGDLLITKAGRIGSAAVFPHQFSNGNITSHLVRARLNSEYDPYYVAEFLETVVGKAITLRHSFKSTRPELTKGEVENCLVGFLAAEEMHRVAQASRLRTACTNQSMVLTTAAKLLVEALIEGQVSEADLVAAQKALEANDRSADRAILQRLTRKGMDATGEAALFPDLDALYDALDALDGREGVEG